VRLTGDLITMPEEKRADIDFLIEEWRIRFLREGFEFDDLHEISIYQVSLVPFRRCYIRKRDQREFNAYPITDWEQIDPMAVDDYSAVCFEHFNLQEKRIMRQTMEEYAVLVFPVIVSPNVDSISLSHVQRHHVSHGADMVFPVVYDMELEQVYMRRTNPGKGDPFFDPFRAEIEFILKG
jgi:hypothetical protein